MLVNSLDWNYLEPYSPIHFSLPIFITPHTYHFCNTHIQSQTRMHAHNYWYTYPQSIYLFCRRGFSIMTKLWWRYPSWEKLTSKIQYESSKRRYFEMTPAVNIPVILRCFFPSRALASAKIWTRFVLLTVTLIERSCGIACMFYSCWSLPF